LIFGGVASLVLLTAIAVAGFPRDGRWLISSGPMRWRHDRPVAASTHEN